MAPLITSILLKWTQYNRSGKDSKVIQSWILPRLHFPAVWSWAGPFYPLFLKFLTYWMVTRHLPYVIIVISWHGQCVLYKWIYSHSLLFCFSCSLPLFYCNILNHFPVISSLNISIYMNIFLYNHTTIIL